MAEATYVAQRKTRLSVSNATRNGEFATVGFGLNNNLVDVIYKIYLDLMFEVIDAPKTATQSDVFLPYITGYYVPVSQRLVFSGQIDLKNFVIPTKVNVCRVTEYPKEWRMGSTDVCFYSIVKVDKLPRGYVCPGLPQQFFKAVLRFPADDAGKKKGVSQLNTYFIGVRADGVTLPCYDVRTNQLVDPVTNGLMAGLASEVTSSINAMDEARYLWRVDTKEKVISNNVETPLSLGVDADHVKSLFYARSAPMTDAGRKRPILHWVEAHQRRLKSGTDVDISKHLRGITEFEMDGMPFKITSPIKVQ